MTEYITAIVRGYNVAWMVGSSVLVVILLYARAHYTREMRSAIFALRSSGIGLAAMLLAIVVHRLHWYLASVTVGADEQAVGILYATWSETTRVWLVAAVALFLAGAAYGVDIYARPVLGSCWRWWFAAACVGAFVVGLLA